jgi:eukaryotic-like serine/threonine-protein kinase
MKTNHSGKYRQITLIVTLSVLFVLLLTACSAQVTGGQVAASPTAAELSATETAAATPTQPAPTATATQEEPTATPIPPTATITPTPMPGIGSTRMIEIDGMEQVYVPAGEFLMGSTDPEAKTVIEFGRAYPEIPQHTVYLDGYWIDKFEVTNRQYAVCVESGGCTPPFVNSNYTYSHYYDNPDFANYPVVWVDWYQAGAYCTWAGRRLPTEAEWEKASRGTDGQKYPWGEDPVTGERANFCDKNCTRTIANTAHDDGYPDTAPVGSYPAGASPYGAMDMSGNVWEWVSSLIAPYPYDADDGREDPDSTDERAWRGGPWSNGYWWMRSSVRYRSVSNYKWYVLGIRCASSE